MLINGKKVERSSICVSRGANTADYVWIAYDNSNSGVPVAIAPSVDALAEMMGVKRTSIESNWCNYLKGRQKTAKYAKVYIGGDDDDDLR